jgi:thymidylate kinase
VSRHPFVCIEGLDAVGKTTVAKALAVALEGVYYKTPSSPYDSLRASIDAKADPVARFYFYLSAVAFASAEIGELLKTSPVVCDRYLYSTVAYHRAMDARLRADGHALGLLVPDYAALLVVDEGERLRRLSGRAGGPVHDAKWEADTAFLAKVEREFRTMPLTVVDTSTLTVAGVVEHILAAVHDVPVSGGYARA